jgi:hypothetical protein
MFAVVGICGCGSDSGSSNRLVEPASALAAIVTWALAEPGASPSVTAPDTAPTEDQPVVYLTAQSGETIDAGIQASVVESLHDEATVRFADERTEAVDDESDDEPVRDNGVMLIVGELPDGERVADVDVEWYRSSTDFGVYVVEVRATPEGADVTDAQAG